MQFAVHLVNYLQYSSFSFLYCERYIWNCSFDEGNCCKLIEKLLRIIWFKQHSFQQFADADIRSFLCGDFFVCTFIHSIKNNIKTIIYLFMLCFLSFQTFKAFLNKTTYLCHLIGQTIKYVRRHIFSVAVEMLIIVWVLNLSLVYAGR